MRNRSILAAAAAVLLLAMGTISHAASDPYIFADDSSPMLMSRDDAIAVWRSKVNDGQRDRIRKLYPVSKWGFISQVEGGFTPDKTCVVTARVMMVPRSTGGRLLFKPTKSATTFAAQPGATVEQCRATAAEKLQEAVYALLTSLIAP